MNTTELVQGQLDRIRGGDLAARSELFGQVQDRLRSLARRMLRGFPRVRRWEDTDDVLQNTMVRLSRAIETVPFHSSRDFFRLAATQLRRELIDLARSHFGPQGGGSHYATPPLSNGPNQLEAVSDPDANDPVQLAKWSDFHIKVSQLPDEEREAFDLLWYNGLTQDEAAKLLNISPSTLKRRWLSAKLRLVETMESLAY